MGGVREATRPTDAREVRAALERGGQDLQDLVDLLRDQTGVAMATITVLDARTFCFTTVAGAEPFETEHDQAVCRWSMPHDRVFSIEDLASDPRTAALPYVDGRLGSLRFYASAPLHTPDGDLVGRLCLFGTEPRTLTTLEARLLQVLARDVSAIIACVSWTPSRSPGGCWGWPSAPALGSRSWSRPCCAWPATGPRRSPRSTSTPSWPGCSRGWPTR